MRWLDRIRTQTLVIVALLAVFVAATVVSPYLPHTALHAQQTGPSGVPGPGSGEAVNSVFGRSGAVAAASGDYTAAQVTNAAAINAANIFSALQTFNAGATLGSGQSVNFVGNDTFNVYSSTSQNTLLFSTVHEPNFAGLYDNSTSNLAGGWELYSNFGYAFGPSGTGFATSGLYQAATSLLESGSGNGRNSNGGFLGYFEAGGTVFTVANCGIPTATGGGTAGIFTAGSTTCDPVITTGITANHGYACSMRDLTTTAASLVETAYTTTTVTFTGTGVASGDTILLGPCTAF